MKKVAYNIDCCSFGLSDEAEEWLMAHGKTADWCLDCASDYEKRSDPLLIECIETLGYSRASAWQFSDIRIAEIDEDRYTILENGECCEQVITPSQITWYE